MATNSDLLRHRHAGRGPALGEGPSRQVLRRLELTITRRLDGLLQGEYEGLVPGHGSDLGETRPYAPGDDVRRIDWNVTARMPDVHVRQTIVDRELEAWLVVDLSASLRFGTAECEKQDLIVAGAGAVSFLTQRTGNRIGAVIVHGDRIDVIPARTGRRHVQSLLHRVLTAESVDGSGATNLGHTIDRAGRLARRRGLVVVLSDFLSTDDWERPMAVVGARHDVLGVEVLDPREMELPDVGVIDVVDPETGRHMEVQTRSRKLRRRYADTARAQREQIASGLRAAGADHLQLRTDRDWFGDLVEFVMLRRQRIDKLPGGGPR